MSTHVQERREALGLSRDALAQAAEISYDYVRKLEAGRSTPTIKIARRVARALRTSVDRLWPVAEEVNR